MVKMQSILTLILVMIGTATMSFAQNDASAASLYNSGLEKMKAKLYLEAVPLFEQAIATADATSETDAKVVELAKRNGAIANYYAGSQLRKAKKLDDASRHFEQGITYDSAFYANYVGRAQIFEDKSKYAEAVGAYLTAAAVAEKTDKADKVGELTKKAESIAGVAWGKKQWDSAIAAAEAFLAAQESGDVRYYFGQSLKEKKQYDRAIENAKKALELAAAEDKDRANFGLAEIYKAAGKKSDAIATYKMVSGAKYGERAKYEIKQLEGTK